MRISPELTEATSLVNAHLPKHARGVIEPNEMLRLGASNCFGRLALIGAGLIESGMPESRISFMVSHAHSVEFGEGRRWFGHAELAIDEPDMILVDAMTQASHWDLRRDTSWAEGHTSTDTVIDYRRAARPTSKPIDWDALRGVEELTGPPHIHALQHLFSVYPFREGIAHYQSAHPHYDNVRHVRLEDYVAKYQQLAASMLSLVEPEIA